MGDAELLDNMIELLTALLVVITGIYAFLTHRILKANESAVSAVREQNEALTRPYLEVSPYLPPKTSIFYLRIRNVGKTAALSLELELDRDFFRFGRVQADHNLDLPRFGGRFTAWGTPPC